MRGTLLDVATIVVLVAAGSLLLMPGSAVRIRWERLQRDQTTLREASSRWNEMVNLGSRVSSTKGAITVIEVSDYECPFCRQTHATVDSAAKAGIKIVYLHFPISSHLRAPGASIAAMCAEQSGRFPEMHNQLMTSTEWQRDTNWIREARAAGIPNLNEFSMCIRSKSMKQRLAHQIQLGNALLVTGTPTFLGREALHRGVASFEQIVTLGAAGK